MLRASQIVLATTQPTWEALSITEMSNAVTQHWWPARMQPTVRLVTGLGTGEVKDQRLDPATGSIEDWQ